jgi:hypothetical protein
MGPYGLASPVCALLELMYTPAWLAAHPGPYQTLGDPCMPAHARRRHLAASNQHDAWQLQPGISAPTLVVHDSGDLLNPAANASLLANQIPRARLHMIPGARHAYFEEYRAVASPLVLPRGDVLAVRLGRAFTRPTYDDGEDQEPGELGEPEAAVPDDDGTARVRRRKMKRGPVAGFDLVLRPPASVSLLRALRDGATVAVIDASQDVAVADTLAWVEDVAVVVYSGPGGTKWERPVGGLVVARFRHHDSRHRKSLLHDHLVASVKVRRADGKWGDLDSRRLLAHVVAAGALYNQRIL